MTSSRFLWLGNHPATDLCNTDLVVDGAPRDLLADYADLRQWTAECGIEPPGQLSEREGAAMLRWVRRVRAALRALLDPTSSTSDPDALSMALAGTAAVLEVHRSDGGYAVRLAARNTVGQVKLDIAEPVLDIFNHDLSLVRRCANPDCVLLFLDVSRSGRRRWCDMSTCGNRAKVAAHYARTQAID